MKRKEILIAIGLFAHALVYAQPIKKTSSVQQVWTAYNNQTRFSNKWGSWTDIHLRTKEDFATNFSQAILRLGLTYYLADNTKLTAGYAYVNHFPADNHNNVSQPEHRPWQQLQWHTRYTKLRTMQWLRLEERYRRKIKNNDELGDGYNFNFRLRYNFLMNVPLNPKGIVPKSWSLVFNDEVHINFGKQIVYNYFDQNRFFAGFSYHTNAHDKPSVGVYEPFSAIGFREFVQDNPCIQGVLLS
ncbi:MAG: DUF2490 domain-containing protein [Chitinophagaceae bacterium]